MVTIYYAAMGFLPLRENAIQMPLRLFQIVKEQSATLSLAASFGGSGTVSRTLLFVNTLNLLFRRFVPVETIGIEPTTSALQGRRSPS
jgi:hypothetical protein